MKTLRIAQIGSTDPIDFSKNPLPAPFADGEICVDYFIDSLADSKSDAGIFHGAELEKRHLQAPYDLLLLDLPGLSEHSEKITPGLQSLFQIANAFAASYTLPVFYSADLGLKGEEALRGELKRLRDRLYEAHEELERLQEFNQMLLEESEHLRALQTSMEYSYEVISNSFFWKLTKPFRLLADVTKKVIKKIPPLHAIFKGLRYWHRNGTRAFFRKMTERGGARHAGAYSVNKKELRAQQEATFERDVKFSILVPLYNTPIVFLKEMIASVQAQTYSNWELCLADGSDAEHADVESTVRELMKNDPRILYRKLEKNLGISENTNACIEMSSGDYIALFDHDDILHPYALYEVMRRICEENADFIYTDEATFLSPKIKNLVSVHFKPDYAPDSLRAINYICHLSVFSRHLMDKVGRFRSEFDGSQDHDMILRLTEQAEKIVHIPKVLYYWRSHPQSVAMNQGAKSYAAEAGQKAVLAAIKRAGMDATVESSHALASIYRIRYRLETAEKVSIIIPNKNHYKDLKLCIESILTRTTYPNYEIVIVDNGSTDGDILAYYEELRSNPRIKLCSLNIPFNYSKLNNYAVTKASGAYYLLLNNDIEILTPGWIEEMLMYVQRKDVGAAGAMLYYPNDTVQHAGVTVGIGGIAGHSFKYFKRSEYGYMGRMCYAQNVSAVTAACLLIKASVYHAVGGFDENLRVAFNDIDLCMKVRKEGYLIVWTPHAEAYHYESRSRGFEDTPEKKMRFNAEIARFRMKWGKELEAGDPYYNPNLTLEREDFSFSV